MTLPFDTYFVLFVEKDSYIQLYTSPIDSRVKAEKHADWLVSLGHHGVRVVKEI